MPTFEGNSIARLRAEDYCRSSFAPHSHLRLPTCINYISFMLKEKKKKRNLLIVDLFNCLATHLFILVVLLSPFPPSLPLSSVMNPRLGFKGQLCVFGSTEWLIYLECKYQTFLSHYTHTHLTGETHRHVAVSVSARQTDPGLC